MKYPFYLVIYQMPFDLIVGIYKSKRDAIKHCDSISDKHAPIWYPCDFENVEGQSGYRKYHKKEIDKIRKQK